MPVRRLGEPIGMCIYCGSTKNIGDEHLFPEGAGGDVIVAAASCPVCATATSQFERSCLRVYFGAARAHLNLYGRRRPEGRPTTFPVVNREGDTTEQIPISEYPFSIIRLELDPPGMLAGLERHPDRDVTHDFGLNIVTLPDAADAINEFRENHPGMAVPLTVPISDFYRLLAKVGHAFAVGVLGNGAFTPALADFIRNPGGDIAEGAYYIGGAFEFGKRVETMEHGLYAHQATLLRSYARERGWIVVRTQLFAPLGAVYDVFVGRL